MTFSMEKGGEHAEVGHIGGGGGGGGGGGNRRRKHPLGAGGQSLAGLTILQGVSTRKTPAERSLVSESNISPWV